MKKSKILWWLGLVAALIMAALNYCSCSVLAVTAGKAHSSITTTTTTTTTTSVDSNSIQTPKIY